MGKLLLISFNLVLILVSKLYFGGDVTVKQQFPEYAKPGETFEIQIEIEKGDREGFAKWQQKLPSGLVAKKGRTEGGTFSFKNQEIKIIWLTLPQVEKFTISYELQAEPSVVKEYSLDGKFSYIEENERKEVIAEKRTITITNNAVASITQDDSNENDSSMELSKEMNERGEEMVEKMAEKIEPTTSKKRMDEYENKAIDSDNIQITRRISHKGNGFYVVNLEISNPGIQSFGKLEEFIPPTYTASAIDNQEGVFSFSNNVMKVMWMTFPNRDRINLQYGIQSTSNEADSSTIFGIFSFLENAASKQIKLEGSRFKNYLASEIMAEVTTETSPSTTDKEKEKPKMMEETTGEEKSADAEKTPIMKEPELVDKSNENEGTIIEAISQEEEIAEKIMGQDKVQAITNIPVPDTDISYRVQIAASKREVQQQYFIDRHNITEQVSIQPHQGWYKYTIGSYNQYKAARDKRNKIWGADNKINDAFVTAYSSGTRVSVQEALMVSKQKWYK